MESFSMQIAGLVTQVNPMFETTREYCRAYLTDQQPELTVTVSPDDLLFEQMMFEREAIEEGMKIRKFTDPFLERASIQRRIADVLIDRNTLLMHGSTVAVDGFAYLFTAPCGTGKSTHTRLWRNVFGDRAVMVNDDKTFLAIHESEVFAYGSPWSGKHGLHNNICVPLKGICILRRGKTNAISRVTSDEGRQFLLHQAYVPDDTSGEEKVLPLTESLLKTIPLWEMQCNVDPEAARISHDAMSAVTL